MDAVAKDQVPPRRPWRRRQYLINRRFQLRFIVHMNVLAMLIIAVVYMANRYFFWKLGRTIAEQGIPADHMFFKYLHYQAQAMDTVVAATAVIILVVLSAFGLLYSHRIAGPLYRLTQYMRSPEGENQPPLTFRAKDFFPELAVAFNEYCTRLRQRRRQ